MTDETSTMTDTSDGAPVPRVVTFRGESYALAGSPPELGAVVPDFRVTRWWNAVRIEISLADVLAPGLPVLFSVVQSVDAPISRLQANNFDLKLAEFKGAVVGLQISSDLPITINRFFRQEEITRLQGLSDYYDQNFGRAYGVLIEEPRILTRAVFVTDWKGVLRHAEIVPELTREPDYDAALAVLRELVVDAPGAVAAEPPA